ncbi:MAG: DUF1992 domain-containing protein [Chloroflexi bacterium]|nr:DUF1992 domain-containing protein [Chloroflexota bacterium]
MALKKLSEWESVIEKQIREAQERGEFDNLTGQGQPLPAEPWDEEWGLAHHLLRQAGETPTWISIARDIEAAQAKLHGLLCQAPTVPAAERARARERYLREAAALDQLLQEYAFLVPSRHLERGRLPAHIAAVQFDAATRSA